MGLNNLKPDANSKFNQGYYTPKNPHKYGGNLSSGIIYRSSLEKKVCIYCDLTPSVTKWSCENIIIQYNDHEGKNRRYYPDFYLEFMTPDKPDFIIKYVLEVKPYIETIAPVIPENLSKILMLKVYRQVLEQELVLSLLLQSVLTLLKNPDKKLFWFVRKLLQRILMEW
jgi:hypothetical protein